MGGFDDGASGASGGSGLSRWARWRRRGEDGDGPQGSVAVPLLVAAGACLLVSTGGWLISGGGHSPKAGNHLQESLPDGSDGNAAAVVSGSPRPSGSPGAASASPSTSGSPSAPAPSGSPGASGAPGAGPGAPPGAGPGTVVAGGGSTGGGSGGSGSGGGGGGGGSVGFPSAGSTGPGGCGSYAVYTGPMNITTSGTTLSCLRINGTLEINASNVTVSNCIVTAAPTSWWGIRFGDQNASATNFRLLNSRVQSVPGQGPDSGEYDYGVDQAAGGYMELGGNDISGYQNDVELDNGYLHDNYIHGTTTRTAIEVGDGTSVRIDHNTILAETSQSHADAAIDIPSDSSEHGRTVTDNLLGGGAYAMYGGGSGSTSIVVTGNAFTTRVFPNSGYWGVVGNFDSGNAGNVWSGNTFYDGPSAGQPATP